MDYKRCIQEASKKRMKLCPRGYCTAKSKFEVYPSAYANGYAAQVCNGTKPDIEGNLLNDYENRQKSQNSELSRWYAEKWVNVCEKDNKNNYLPCGRKKAILNPSDYPYCRPLHKQPGTSVLSVEDLTERERNEMCRLKRSIRPGVNGKPTRVYVANMLIKNPATGRLVKSDGVLGRKIQRGGAGKKYLPNMTLVNEYNRDKGKQHNATYRGKSVTLYAPEISDKALKKLQVYVEDPETNEIKRIDFGHSDYEDFTIHRNKDRQRSYCARSGGIECKDKMCGVDSANYWSRMVLWDC